MTQAPQPGPDGTMKQLFRASLRLILRAWGALGRAPGWRYQMIERFGPRLGPADGKGLDARLPNGLTMSCDLRDEVQRNIYFWGCYEPIDSMIFSKLVRRGMVVIDAGANVGNYTLLASAAVGETGHVYAFEPVPATHARLIAAVARNHLANVTVNRMALWDEPTVLQFGLPTGHDRNAGAYSVSGGAVVVTAEAQPLDSFLAKAGIAKVDIIKMDIEGAELRALKGMRETLTRDRPLLFMEVNREAAESAGSSPAKLGAFLLGELHYKAWSLTTRAGILSLDSIDRANVLFHAGELPVGARERGTDKQVLRWARSGGALATRDRL